MDWVNYISKDTFKVSVLFVDTKLKTNIFCDLLENYFSVKRFF